MQRLVLTPSCLGRCLVPRIGFPNNMDIRETEGSKGSFNDLIPRQSSGNAFYPGKINVSVWKTPSFDLSESLFCTIMTYFDFYCLQIDHWDLGVIVTIVSILFVSIKLY